MVGPAAAISESASPHLRKANSPYSAREDFRNDNTDAQADAFNCSNSNISINTSNNTPGSRRSTFSFSNGTLNFLVASTDSLSRPLTGNRVIQLAASFSNPSLLQGSTASLSVPSFREGALPRFGRSQSMVMDILSSESTSLSKKTASIVVTEPCEDIEISNYETKDYLSGLKTKAVARESDIPTIMSQSQPALFQFQIGPIARKNFREQTSAKEEAILRTSQLLLSDKSWVRSKQSDSGEAPSLDLHPFSPYSPGIHGLNSATVNTVYHQRDEQNLPIDLNEFCKRVDILPKEEDDESDDEEEEGEEDREESECLKEVQHEYMEEQLQEYLEDYIEGFDGEIQDEYQRACTIEHNGEYPEEQDTEEKVASEDCMDKIRTVDRDLSQEPEQAVKAGRTLNNYEIDFALDTSTWGLMDGEDQDFADVTNPAETLELIVDRIESRDLIGSRDAVEPDVGVEAVTESVVVPLTSKFTTESEAIAKQWRRSQSTSLLIQRPDGSTVAHIVHHESLGSSQFLEKRQKRQGSQERLSSTGSLSAAARASSNIAPYSPLINSSTQLELPSADTTTTFEAQTAMSDGDEASIAAPSTFTERSVAPSSTLNNDHFESPTPSTNSINSVGIQGKKPAKIDTALPRLGITVNPLHHIKDDSIGKEQVVASKVWRSGKLFAKKIKTIAVFEYNTAKKLGKGNFGIVYQGKKINENVEVAIKKITRKLPGEIEKLGLVQREMRVCRLFNNRTGIVPLLDIITTNKHHYLVFEKAEGDLAEMLRTRCKDALGRRSGGDVNKQPMSPSCCLGNIFAVQEIRSIMHTVVLGAQALHKEGYSHKDIKPANILFSRGRGLLCDFGLCSQNDELPQNQFFGTQDYASPEARRVGCRRECDYIQSDVYSLGAVLYELATGSVLSKVISQGLNWQKIANFGGREFSELLQGMVNDIEKRWSIDQVVSSPFWGDLVLNATSPRSLPILFSTNTTPLRGLESSDAALSIAPLAPASLP
ncbi:hypothetical protein BGX27_007683 [Mortierella sp. AM989]|nr:hypothetical protein BGX27_007683 [Mortierella sp. AM989]